MCQMSSFWTCVMLQLLVLILFVSESFAGFYSSTNVLELTQETFKNTVVRSDEFWIVEFYAPWCEHCKQFVPEFKKAAAALKGVIKVGAVNAEEYQNLGDRYNVESFPSFKLFGADKSKPTDYTGPRSAHGIASEAFKLVRRQVIARLEGGEPKRENEVVELTDDNFDKLVLRSNDMWLVDFFAPWCGHCKTLAPHWKRAANQLKGKVKLGALDATVHHMKANEYNINQYPIVKYFPYGPKSRKNVAEYKGGMTADDIVIFALERLADSLPAPDIVQILDEETFKVECKDRSLCVISIMPHILDCQSNCRMTYLGIVKDLAEKYKMKRWGWTWSEAGVQANLENALGIGDFGYPTMAVINAKKMKCSVLRGSFSKDGIDDFLRVLSFGRGTSSLIRGTELPRIVETKPWNGRDGHLSTDKSDEVTDIKLEERDEF